MKKNEKKEAGLTQENGLGPTFCHKAGQRHSKALHLLKKSVIIQFDYYLLVFIS
jgi:hypothetical protein